MKPIRFATPLVLAFALIGLAGADETANVVKAEAEPVVIPEAYVRMKAPTPTKKSINYGGLLFSSQCSMCHGKTGTGDGELVAEYELPMMDLSNRAVQAKRTDGEYYYIITKGHQRMQAQGDRFGENTWDLIHYIRTLDD